jgi:hypothetical protein
LHRDEGAGETSKKVPTSRRNALFSGGAVTLATAVLGASSPPVAFAEYAETTEYMPSLEGKDYGKSKYTYPDFVQTPSGLQARRRGSGGALFV